MLKRQFQVLAVALVSGWMQTDYVWDVWDFLFLGAGALSVGLFLFGDFER